MRIRVTLDHTGLSGARTEALCTELLVDAPPGTPFADLRNGLASAVGRHEAAHALTFISAGHAIPPQALLGEPPLLDGVLIHVTSCVGSAPTSPAPGQPGGGLLELHVVAGPGSGRAIPLTSGAYVIGRSRTCSIRLDDQSISRVHLQLEVCADGVTIRDLEATNPSLVDGRPVAGDHLLAIGQRLRLGSSVIAVRRPEPAPASTTTGDGIISVHRAPRFDAPRPMRAITFPEPPRRPDGVRLPLLAAVAPLVAAGVVSVAMRSPMMLLFALLSPVMLVSQWFGDRRNGRTSHRKALAGHETVVSSLRAEVRDALQQETSFRHAQSPDLALMASIARGPGNRLWERRPQDPDHLLLRVGLGAEPAEVRLAGAVPADLDGAVVDEVPVTLSLADIGVLGVSGPRPRVLAQAASLILQLATWHSPRQLRLVVLTSSASPQADWGWASRLPHVQPLTADTRIASVMSAGDAAMSAVVAELEALLATRTDSAGRAEPSAEPGVVVVLDGAHDLRRAAGVAGLLQHGPSVGIHFVCLDEATERLPAETAGHVELDGARAPRATVHGRERTTPDVLPDLPSRAWVEHLARSLAPLRDATPDHADKVPAQVGFRELHASGALAMDPTDPTALARHWGDRDRSRDIVIGLCATGAYAIDLRSAGPHALVAGTTGAGKSELLQTLIAGLAVAHDPDELSLVLVDYKGGSAFSDCARLPHTAGLVTDLDEHLAARALTSLGAELKRRERLLAEHGAKDLDDYLYNRATGSPTIPRLVLVVDEFKVLAEELPDFVDGLVRLAAVGRSLGIHLVLATQRPAGIVSADMRANIGLRICLRVRDRADSVDVVESPEASTISDRLPGRALVRTAGLDLHLVQIAYVGGPADASQNHCDDAPAIWPLSWSDLSAAPPRRVLPSPPADQGAGRTELTAMVEAARSAAEGLGFHANPSPWLPPLPHRLPVAALARDRDARQAVALGLVDHPALQRQEPWVWRWRDGHLGLVGGSRTGRTTTVRLVALQLAEAHAPNEVQLHVIEGGSTRLRHLETLPHVGSVVGVDDPGRARRLVARLLDEVAARRTRTTHDGAHLVLLIDGWEAVADAFETVDHGAPTEELLRLVRDGLSAGVSVVMTGGRALTGGRLSPLLQQRLVLPLPDPLDAALAGVAADRLPVHRGPGRAVDPLDGCEVQLAFAGASPEADDQDHAVAMAATVVSMEYAALPATVRPWRIQPLPDRVLVADLPAPTSGLVPVGLGGDDLDPLGFDATLGHSRVLVAGPARSGRSTALLTLARQLHHGGRTLAVIPGHRSPLSELSGIPRVHVLDADDTDTFVALRRDIPALALLIDDAEALEGSPVEGPVLEALRVVDTVGGLVAASVDLHRAATIYRGIVPEIARHATGLLLAPRSPSDGELFRTRVGPQGDRRPGRGVHIGDGVATPVQVALTEVPTVQPWGPAVLDPCATHEDR